MFSRTHRRGALAGVLTALAALAWAASAVAAGPRSPRIPLTQDPVSLQGYCAFPVLLTFPDFNQYIIHQTFAPDGTTTLQIAGRARAVATNTESGKSVSYNISGPGTLVLRPDGSFSIDSHGPNLLWTAPENSFPGVPTISYTTGHVRVDVAASGQTTSYSLAGRRTDVCAVLAA